MRVLDDEPDALDLLATVLETAAPACSVQATPARLSVHETQARRLISDIGMPGDDGYALIEWIRGLSEHDGGSFPRSP